jgi:hypothetical protein
MSVDTDLAAKLIEELDKTIADATQGLARGLPYDQYQQAVGMIEAYKQVRFALIPQTLDEIQRR